jgi:hypothetical protein
MGDITKLDADIPNIRSLVQFRNHDQPCIVIRQDKARSDAKVFREAASMLSGSDRGRALADWLTDLAGKYEQMENPQVEAKPSPAPTPTPTPEPAPEAAT